MTEQLLLNRFIEAFSFSGDALVATNYSDDYIVQGRGYQIVKRIDHTSGQTQKLAVDFTGVSNDKAIFVMPISFTANGQFEINTYSITAYTGGTDYTPLNLNRNSSNVAQTVIKHGVSSDDTAGADVRQYLVGSGGNPASRAGGSTSAAFAVITNNESILLIETVNKAGADATLGIVFTFFEIPIAGRNG